jgi:alkanesulfonate monooxygenase SsuD/methylene tetrahydromethanopterin reductase-like flavin-dependent oxidoreductase (luciferase family)
MGTRPNPGNPQIIPDRDPKSRRAASVGNDGRVSALPRFSVSISSTHDTAGPARMIERTRTAHAAGFASLTIGDHHDMPVPYAQNTPMLGRLLAEWPNRTAGCLFLMPLWHPLLMAEHIGTLSAIHQVEAPGKPFIVQTGIGWGAAQFVNLGADMSTRGAYIDAAIPIVKALLAGEHVDDEAFGLRGARVGLRADVSYDWWIGGTAPVALGRAARLGDAWYATPGASDDELAASIEAYKAAGGRRVMLRRDAVVMADHEAARRRAAALVAQGYRGMSVEQLLVGSPYTVAARAVELAALGVDELVIRCAANEQDHALETLEALGTVAGEIG